MKPPMPYYGGKQRIADRIVATFPDHLHYVIREADALADERWPQEARHYTYVAPQRVRSTNPGYCFQQAGWRRCGLTKGGHGRDQLVILERF